MTHLRPPHKPARNAASLIGATALLFCMLPTSAAFANEPVAPPEAVEQVADETTEGTSNTKAPKTLDADATDSKTPETKTPQPNDSTDTKTATTKPQQITPETPTAPLDPPTTEPQLTLSPAAVNPGERIHVTGGAGLDDINLTFDHLSWPTIGDPSESDLTLRAEIMSGTNNTVDSWLTIPNAMAPGEYRVGYSCVALDVVYCTGEMTLTVLGTVPTSRPAGGIMAFTADPLEGKAGDTVNIAASCTYNGASANALNTTWIFAGGDITPQSQPLQSFPLDANGSVNGQITVPSNAVPKFAAEHFDNSIWAECAIGDMVFGYSSTKYTVVTDAVPPVTPVATTTPTELANTGSNQLGVALSALATLALGAALLSLSRRRTA